LNISCDRSVRGSSIHSPRNADPKRQPRPGRTPLIPSRARIACRRAKPGQPVLLTTLSTPTPPASKPAGVLGCQPSRSHRHAEALRVAGDGRQPRPLLRAGCPLRLSRVFATPPSGAARKASHPKRPGDASPPRSRRVRDDLFVPCLTSRPLGLLLQGARGSGRRISPASRAEGNSTTSTLTAG